MAEAKSYVSAMFTVNELISMTHSTASVCLSRLQGYVLNFIHLLAVGVAETLEFNNYEWCPNTFVCIL